MEYDLAGGRKWEELPLRLASALILIPFALVVVHLGGWWLALGAGLFAGAMAYEWCTMSGQGPAWLVMSGLFCINFSFGYFGAFEVLLALLVFALLFAGLHARQFSLRAMGVMYAGGLPLALQVLREGGAWEGQAAALIILAIVWSSDTGAYFAGRGLGGPLLSANSPNKTWSGAIGALVCSIIVGFIAAIAIGENVVAWMVFSLIASICAQAGDLFESQIKRHFGVKDASGLVPGHGGVMDRVDGLGAVCLLAVAAFLAFPGLVTALGLEMK